MEVYITTWYGDLTLERRGQETLMKVNDLTAVEEIAVSRLLSKYKIDRPNLSKPQEIILPAPLEKVHGVVTKALKKNDPVLTCIRVEKGQIVEIKGIHEAEEKKAEVVATTPAPRKGCPMPAFDPTLAKEIRATRVLEKFLNPSQMRDFRRQASFVVVGADTGTKYLVNHRHSELAASRGMVYDLDRSESTCVERTEQPPTEELLGLLFVLSSRGRETQWRALL